MPLIGCHITVSPKINLRMTLKCKKHMIGTTPWVLMHHRQIVAVMLNSSANFFDEGNAHKVLTYFRKRSFLIQQCVQLAATSPEQFHVSHRRPDRSQCPVHLFGSPPFVRNNGWYQEAVLRAITTVCTDLLVVVAKFLFIYCL